MSNEVALFGGYKGGLPAHLQGLELDATTKALMGSSGAGKRISIKGGVFRMMVDGKEVGVNEDRAMNFVIVAANPNVSRSYYENTYVEGEVSAPDCASIDGITPDAGVKNKQADKCATCPQNIAGSGQGDSRACRFAQRVAVVLENNMEGDVYQVQLPATSIFGKPEKGKHPLQSYARFLGANGLPITAVVTEARFDTDSATPKLTFRAIRPLSVEEMKVAMSQGASDEAKTAITNTPAAMDGAKTEAAEPATKPATKAKPAAKEKPAAQVEEETAAPTKVAKKKAAPVVTEPEEETEDAEGVDAGVTSVLDEIDGWDDQP